MKKLLKQKRINSSLLACKCNCACGGGMPEDHVYVRGFFTWPK
ncbi:hypothetical protein PV797_03155 [Clostridiaceae bacterium M8S5]|nr:hypothetical protein PV797_03155 [Clostridiaceae bacterium M8S5]